MRGTTYAVALFVAVAAGLAGNSTPARVAQNAANPTHATRHAPDSASETALARSVNAFACDLYRRLRTTRGNLIVSPLSVSAAMGLAYAGASGVTRTEMQRVLHLASDDSRVYKGYLSLCTQLDDRARTEGSSWTLANSIWIRKGAPLQSPFVRTVRESFRSEVDALDFQGAPEVARQTMNRWAEKRTADRIRNLFPRGSIVPSTRLVLADAVYFKGRWATAFDPRGTQLAPFHLAAGVDKPTQLMSLVHRFRFAHMTGAKMLELPYRGERLSMLVLLPDESVTLRSLEARLSEDSLRAWTGALHEIEVDVRLPRFTATRQFELSPALAALGMTAAFDARAADFSGITGDRTLSISLVIHKAFAQVDEAGTEAAAATGVVFRDIGARSMPESFQANRPFLFLIRDRATGCILFMGRVSDPTL